MGSELERAIQIHGMGYYLIENRPKVDLAFCEMLKVTAAIRFSFDFNGETVRRVVIGLKDRAVVVVGDHNTVRYDFDDLLQ